MSKILSKERLFAITSDWNKRRKICPKNGNNPHIWLDKGKVSTKAYNHRKRKESWEPFSMILTRSICKYCNWVKYQERDETGRFILGDEDWKKSYLKIENTVFLRAEDLSVDFKLFRSPQPLQEINLTKEDILEKVKIFTKNYIYYPYGNGTVYVLHLKTGRCYVGWTSNYFKRKIVHANLPKSLWLKKYPADKVDNELQKLQARIAVLNTARAAYFFTLKDEMSKAVN